MNRQRIEEIRDRWDGAMTDLYPSGTEEADYRDIHDLLVEIDRLTRQVEAINALRDRVSDSVAIATLEGRKLKPVVSLNELSAVLETSGIA
jgi:hypothetical protein